MPPYESGTRDLNQELRTQNESWEGCTRRDTSAFDTDKPRVSSTLWGFHLYFMMVLEDRCDGFANRSLIDAYMSAIYQARHEAQAKWDEPSLWSRLLLTACRMKQKILLVDYLARPFSNGLSLAFQPFFFPETCCRIKDALVCSDSSLLDALILAKKKKSPQA